MDIELFLGLLLLVTVVVLPALAITARIALKPVISAILRLNEGLAGGSDASELARRVTALEDTVRELEADVQRLAEVETFDRSLGAGSKRQGTLPEKAERSEGAGPGEPGPSPPSSSAPA